MYKCIRDNSKCRIVCSDAGNPQEQKELFPSVDNGNATVLPDNAGHADSSTVAPRGSTITVEAHRPKAPETPAPARGDGPADKKVIETGIIMKFFLY